MAMRRRICRSVAQLPAWEPATSGRQEGGMTGVRVRLSNV